MRRLFTFGCSYTSWNWPTWADLLGLEVEHFENWGHAGIGNRAIAERVAECHIKNKFTIKLQHQSVIKMIVYKYRNIQKLIKIFH